MTHYFFKGCLYHTPMTSDVEDGRYAVRMPLNLQTGGVAWPRGPDGRRMRIALGPVLGAVRQLITRRPHVT